MYEVKRHPCPQAVADFVDVTGSTGVEILTMRTPTGWVFTYSGCYMSTPNYGPYKTEQAALDDAMNLDEDACPEEYEGPVTQD